MLNLIFPLKKPNQTFDLYWLGNKLVNHFSN